MMELPVKIEELREKISAEMEELHRLEQMWEQFREQLRSRQRYLSSKEIIDLIKERSGHTKTMTAIKRWADEGLLGERLDERTAFPLLGHKQGNKRFLFPKRVVYPFLAERQLIRPIFDILDRVWITKQRKDEPWVGVVIHFQLVGEAFIYTVQMEQTGEITEGLSETFLHMAEEDV